MSHTKWLNDEEMRMWLAFIGASTLVERQLDLQMKEDSGISHLQYLVLMWLNQAPEGRLRMTELAELLLNSKSGLTYQVSQLEQSGLVRRSRCETNSRAIYAELTDQGRETLERAAPGHVEAVRKLVVDALTPEEREVIANGLGRIRDNIVKTEGACH